MATYHSENIFARGIIEKRGGNCNKRLKGIRTYIHKCWGVISHRELI